MALIESESLILRSYNLSEADRIVVFMTREFGVIRGVAKGARRLKSRFGSSLEPFSIVRTEYLQKDSVELVTILSVDLIESNFAAASLPAFLEKFAYLADLLIALSPPSDPNEKLFRMARASVQAAVGKPGSIPSIGVYFEIWLLRLSGLLPDWNNCDNCGRTLDDVSIAGIQANFHLLCTSCVRSGRTRTASPGERKLLRAALKCHPEEFIRIAQSSGKELEHLSANLKFMISAAIGRDVIERRDLSLNE